MPVELPILPKRVAENVGQFTGRAWLLPKILEWWDEGDERLFLLTGGPGTGKSMILAWLAGFGPDPEDPGARAQLLRLREVDKAVQFCQASSRNITPQAFAENIANQLTHTVPGFRDALAATLADRVSIVGTAQAGTTSDSSLTGVFIGRLDLGTLGDELSFDRAFTQPLQKLYASGHTEPMLVLVDALDEALGYTGDRTLPELLSTLSDLPRQVRILMTSRDDPRVLAFYDEIKLFDLIKDAPANVDDVREYAGHRLSEGAHFTAIQIEEFSCRLSTKAKGVFFYAAIVIDELLRLPSLPDLDKYPLPAGLSGIYRAFLKRELGTEDKGRRWHRTYKPLLGLIAVAQGDGLTAELLTALIGEDVAAPLDACKQYLEGASPDGPFRPFHKSFADFLLEDNGNARYHIDAPTMHRQIADHYWAKHHDDWSKCDTYGIESLPIHLRMAQAWTKLEKLFLDPAWLETKTERLNIYALIQDYNLTSNVPHLLKLRNTLRLSAHVLLLDPSQLRAQLLSRLSVKSDPDLEPLLKSLDQDSDVVRLIPRIPAAVSPGGPRLWTFSTKNEEIKIIECSPDGERLASCGNTKLSVLRLADGTELQTLTLSSDEQWVALSQDCRQAVSASTHYGPHWLERCIRVWNLVSGEVVQSLEWDQTRSNVLTLLHDSGSAVSADRGGKILIWDLKTGAILITLHGHTDFVSAAAQTPDGRTLVSASDDMTLRVWNLSTGQETVTLTGHDSKVSVLAVTADGRAVSGSLDGTLRIWNLVSGKGVVALRGHTSYITAIAAIPNRRDVVSAGRDLTLRMWDLEDANQAKILASHTKGVNALAAMPDGAHVLSGFADGTISIWDLRKSQGEQAFEGHEDWITSIKVTPDGRKVVSGSLDQSIKVWDLKECREIAVCPGRNQVHKVHLTPDGKIIIAEYNDGTTILWDLETTNSLMTIAHRKPTGVTLTPDGRYLIAAVSDSVISVIDLQNGSVEREIFRETGQYGSTLAMLPNGRHLIFGYDRPESRITVWDWIDRKDLLTLWLPKTYINDIAIVGDGRRILAATDSGAVKVIDIACGEEMESLQGHSDRVTALGVTPDGSRAVSASRDGTIRVWDLATGREIAHFRGEDSFEACAIAPDGRYIMAGEVSGRIHFLRLTGAGKG